MTNINETLPIPLPVALLYNRVIWLLGCVLFKHADAFHAGLKLALVDIDADIQPKA